MKIVSGVLVMILAAGSASALFAAPPSFPPRTIQAIEGWSVRISDELLTKEKVATERALELLKVQLQEIVRVVPADAVAELRKVPLWFSAEYPGVPPRAEYHPDGGWLREHGRDPSMAKGVEFTNIRIFERETKRMPNFALHELAHAYHDRVLPKGHGNEAVKAAFEKAKKAGLYERVEQRFGDGRSAQVRAYALTNPMEYFAETTEAYFATNDFFPFHRGQLEKHDQEMFALLKSLWSQPTARHGAANWEDWKHTQSIWLLTDAAGADLPAEAKLEAFPTLVRLHKDTFNFAQARPDGGDVRFSLPTGESLPYQVEAWDAAKGEAAVWVRVPLVQGNSRQEIRLHSGNADAASESDGKAVFNTSNGYLSVWHMADPTRDDAGELACVDTGTTATEGVIGAGRRLPGGKGISGGEKIASYPTGAGSHSTEAWFRAAKPNSTIIGWGNEQAQGKVVMQYRSPTHVRMDCYFSGGNVNGERRIPLDEWTHVLHTYREGEARLYVNGVLDVSNRTQGGPLNVRSPARLFIGGWYNNYDFVGDLDEVRVSHVVRSAEWAKLQFENQKPRQTFVGLPVQPGDAFSVSPERISVAEGGSATVRAQAGGAQKVVWTLKRDGREEVVAVDRLTHEFHAGRVRGKAQAVLVVKAIYPSDVKTKEIAVEIGDDIPEPVFTLAAPTAWNGRETVTITPKISNMAALNAAGAGTLNVQWTVENIAVSKEIAADRLVLKRALGSGTLKVTAAMDNGGVKVTQSVAIAVQEPPLEQEPWLPRPLADSERPEDNQFIPREGAGRAEPQVGKLVYAGTLAEPAEMVFLRVFADEKPFATETAKVSAEKKYALTAKLHPGLVKYRTEFGVKAGAQETILHTAKNLVCGDAYLIIGQSNAVATDFGKENSLSASEWIRTFGATANDPNGSRFKSWANAEARSPGGKGEVGYWGLELGRRMVESEKIPVCILNGAVGGTRIDQHQRNDVDPTDAATIYGRLLWRVREAKLTHGIRAVLWHQGENDQGADGPTGGYGYETYRPLFAALAASWKEDYPNIQRLYAFQIWPKSCAMGINGSDNRLREVQRTLPQLFSNLRVMSTLGVKPPGGCHFPAAGYAEFARLLQPMLQHDLYQRPSESFSPPNLTKAAFASAERDAIVLEFSEKVRWSDALVSQFHLDGEAKQVVSGAADGRRLTLKLKGPTQSKTITYLDSANWNPDNLLYGENGIAALTFCEVPLETP